MNNFSAFTRFSALLLAFAFLLTACDSNDPEPMGGAGEMEVISNVQMALTPQGGGAPFTAEAVFNESSVQTSIDPVNLTAGTVYNVEFTFLNRFEDDPEELNEEITEEEDIAHQLFVIPEGGVADDLTISNRNNDRENQPLGTSFTLTVGDAADSGILRVVLRHYEGDSDALVIEQKGDDLDPTDVEIPDVVENDVNIEFAATIAN
ncbi:MAG: hypothetical protein AAGI91_13795 [Bacteroidota bacterium]